MPNTKIVVVSSEMDEDSQSRAKEANYIFKSLFPDVTQINIFYETQIIEQGGILQSGDNYLDKEDINAVFFLGPFETIETSLMNVKPLFNLSAHIIPVVTQQDNFQWHVYQEKELEEAKKQATDKHFVSLHASLQPGTTAAAKLENKIEKTAEDEGYSRSSSSERAFQALRHDYFQLFSIHKYQREVRELRTNTYVFSQFLDCRTIQLDKLKASEIDTRLNTLGSLIRQTNMRRLLTPEQIEKLYKYLDEQKQNLDLDLDLDIVFAFRKSYLDRLKTGNYSLYNLIQMNERFAKKLFIRTFPNLDHDQQEQLIKMIEDTLVGAYLMTHKMEAKDTACSHIIRADFFGADNLNASSKDNIGNIEDALKSSIKPCKK